MATISADAVSVRVMGPDDRADWAAFLARSENGTLFHDLDFLAYHPAGRHAFSHLIFHRGSRPVALLTGTLVSAEGVVEYRSCPAGSFGGFVFDGKVRLSLAEDVVTALLDHARAQGWRSLHITLPPPAYNGRVGQLPSFVLARSGFASVNRQVTFLLPLGGRGSAGAGHLFGSASANKLRGALRKGVTVADGGAGLLPEFLALLDQTFARHGTTPTHSHAELEWLAHRLGDRVRFVVARLGGEAIAALCVFVVNRFVATAMYTCVDVARRNENGVIAALAHAVQLFGEQGLGWLDLGPSGDLQSLNTAVIDFKEGTNPTYGLRDHHHLVL